MKKILVLCFGALLLTTTATFAHPTGHNAPMAPYAPHAVYQAPPPAPHMAPNPPMVHKRHHNSAFGIVFSALAGALVGSAITAAVY